MNNECLRCLATEGRANEIAFVIQQYRKTSDLDMSQRIELSISTDEPYISMACRGYEEEITSRCLISKLHFPGLYNSLDDPVLLGTPSKHKIKYITSTGDMETEFLLSHR